MGFRVLRVSAGQFRVILASDAKPYDVFAAFLEVLSVGQTRAEHLKKLQGMKLGGGIPNKSPYKGC